MPQRRTPIDITQAKAVTDAVKEYIPSWLVDAVAPLEISGLDMLTPVAGPAVSIYKSKPAREMATEAFKKSLDALPFDVRSAWNSLAEQYPRIAAHTRVAPARTSMSKKGTHDARTFAPEGKAEKPVSVVLSDKGMKANAPTARRTAFHEATHVAQALGNSEHDRMYREAQDAFGYTNNPFEVSARAAEDRAVDFLPRGVPGERYQAPKTMEALKKKGIERRKPK